MGLLDFFRSASIPGAAAAPIEPTFAASPAPVPRAASQAAGPGRMIMSAHQLDEYLRNGDPTETGQPVTVSTALSNAAFYAGCRLISGAVATMPLDIKRRVDERQREDASDHPVWRVLRRRPNRWQKPAQFRRQLQMHLLLRGNAYALQVRSLFGDELKELIPLHPDRVRVEQLADLSLVYRYRRPDGSEQRFGQDQILHLVGMTLDGVSGVSVLTYARETIGLSLATRRHGAEFFRNGAQVGSLISHPNHLGQEGVDTLKASLDEFRHGGSHAGGTLVLEEGAKYEQLGMTMEDAAFVEIVKLTTTHMAMFLGVPPHMIGDTEKTTSWGTGIEQQSRGFVAYTLEDWLTCWEEAILADVIGDRESDLYARFNRAALVRGDLKTRWESYVKSLQWGVASPNEVRALEDWNPREGGDVYYDPPNTAGGDRPTDAGDDPEREPRETGQ